MVIESTDYEGVPEIPGVVRIQMFKAVKIEQVGDDIVLTDFSNMDMKGYFPMRLMNMMVATRMPEMIKTTRKALNEIRE